MFQYDSVGHFSPSLTSLNNNQVKTGMILAKAHPPEKGCQLAAHVSGCTNQISE